MKKLILIPVLLFAALLYQQPTKAESYQEELVSVQEEQKEVKKDIKKLQKQVDLSENQQKQKDEKIIALNKQYSKLKAKERAYKHTLPVIDVEEGTTNSAALSKIVVPFNSVPTEYKPIYVAAGEKFGVDWNVLAAIHSIETTFSTNPKMISSVGAVGHMQFMPETFRSYGVDGNEDGQISPWNLEDAIYSAANYLAANNYKNNKRKAIWHYNHAEWYINDVLATAAVFSKGD